MTREGLSEEKKAEYDKICDKIMAEIEIQNPDQYHRPGQLDGRATQIYRETFEKYRPELEKLFDPDEEKVNDNGSE